MTEFRIFETRQFKSDLQYIAKSGHPKIIEKLQKYVYSQLRHHPHYGRDIRKLKDRLPETWRFFHEIDNDQRIVFMTAASHRSAAY